MICLPSPPRGAPTDAARAPSSRPDVGVLHTLQVLVSNASLSGAVAAYRDPQHQEAMRAWLREWVWRYELRRLQTPDPATVSVSRPLPPLLSHLCAHSRWPHRGGGES